MEIRDGYYPDGTPSGRTFPRGVEMPDGLYCMGSEMLVRHKDGSYLITRRTDTKPLWPGREETSCGGAALAGETGLDCAVRELKEELGITDAKLTLIERVVTPSRRNIHYIWLCETDVPKDSLVLQKEEVASYRWVDANELARFINSDEAIHPQVERFQKYFREQGFME